MINENGQKLLTVKEKQTIRKQIFLLLIFP